MIFAKQVKDDTMNDKVFILKPSDGKPLKLDTAVSLQKTFEKRACHRHKVTQYAYVLPRNRPTLNHISLPSGAMRR